MNKNYEEYLDEKFGASPVSQRSFYMTADEAAKVQILRDNGMPIWQAIETVLPELIGQLWVIRSADDAIVVG